MAWFRVDDQSTFHAKVVSAGNAAYGAWIRMGCYCNAQLTDGFVPKNVARLIASRRELASLIQAELLHEVDGGYEIHDYHDFQPSSDEVKLKRAETSAKRAEAGRKGGQASGEARRSRTPANHEAVAKQIASASTKQNEAPSRSRPDPDPEMRTDPRARLDEVASLLKRQWSAWGTRVLTPDGQMCEAAARLLVAYADAAGETDLAALAERAVRVAFVEQLLPSWSFDAPATPALFVRKWDEVQAVLGGVKPGRKAAAPAPAEPQRRKMQTAEEYMAYLSKPQ